MLNRLRAFRERGWREVESPTYAPAWQRFGGSVARFTGTSAASET